MRRLIFLVPLVFFACSPEEERPPRAEPVQGAETSYQQSIGYCFYKTPSVLWKSETLVRGDVQLRGKRKGSRIRVESVWYKLRGDLRRDNNVLEIRSKTWGLSRSGRLVPSLIWRKLPGLGLPRPAKRGEKGVFSFQFNQPLRDKTCTWTFRF